MSSTKQQQQTTTTNSNGSDAKQLREQQTLFQIAKKLHGSSSFDKNKNKKELVSTSNKKKLIRCDESNNPTHIEGSEKCTSYQAEYPPLPSSSSTSTAGSGSDHSVDSTKSKKNDKGLGAGSSAAKPRRSSPAPTTVVSAVAKVLASAPSSIVQPPANVDPIALGKKPTDTEFSTGSTTLLPRSENVEAMTIAAAAKEKKAKANAAKQVTKSYVLKMRTIRKDKEAITKAAAKVDERNKLRSQKNENKKRIQEASDRINKKPEPVIIFVPKGITKINQNESTATTTNSKKKTTKKKKIKKNLKRRKALHLMIKYLI